MPQNDDGKLERRLLEAHAGADNQGLSRLYMQAGDLAESQGQIEAACFYLTHAYVFALEQGMPVAVQLHMRLLSYGREE